MTSQTLGPYRIEEKLGAGGMGVVYRARDRRLDRLVALKLLGERLLADETARARLLREARTASALNHPNICTIYEVGEADGQVYIAMEYVKGRTLRTLVPGEGLPVETALRYGAQIADALSHAHECGIVHRDIKTANVVITPEGQVKVLDFGLAKRLREEVEEATRSRSVLTEVGAVVGTLPYMGPEVLRGEAPDARSDIWALGVVLCEIATGRLPFQGNTGYELSSAILREPPTLLAAKVPPGLRAIIQRCLAKDPGQRYQHASEVRAALEVLQSDTVVAVVLPAAVPRRRWLWGLIVALFVVAGALILAAIRGVPFLSFIGVSGIEDSMPASERGLSTSGRPSPNPEANEYFEKAMLFLHAQFDLSRARLMLETALELDPKFSEARAFYGFTHWLLLDSGYSNDAGLLYEAEQELHRALQDDPNCARAYAVLGAVYFFQGRKELVPPTAEKALKVLPQDKMAKLWLFHYFRLNGDYDTAQILAEELLAQDPLFFAARMNLGDILREKGDVVGAIREQEKVLEQDLQNLYAICRLARVYMEEGDLRRARSVLERARPADRQNYRTRLAWALLFALEGKRTEARKEMDPELLEYASAIASVLAWQVAGFYAVLGEKEKAVEWLDRAVRSGDERAEWFQRDPMLANLRNHPRFQQILDSIKFRRQERPQAVAQ